MPDDKKDDLQPLLGDLVTRAVRRLLGRGRSELGRAAKSGRSKLELRQLQKDLDHFWARLGKTSRRLVEAGEIDHPALRKAMHRIDELERQIDTLRGGTATPDPQQTVPAPEEPG
jgi:hypothetical protein